MPARTVPLVNQEYYHIVNRGVAKMPIFLTQRDYDRFVETFRYYLKKEVNKRFSISFDKDKTTGLEDQIVDVICYCLMPNHFHFLLKQNDDNGIMNFVRKVSNSYAKYFNIKYKRKGPLFEGKFKAVRVETNEQLLHISRYIHLNPLVSFITRDLNNYKWSSYPEFLEKDNNNVCSKDIITSQFRYLKNYEQFILDQEDYGKRLEEIKHQILDGDS
ncbi:MAG: transposase [Candidatus Levyibacteriota bacterium]